MTALILTAPSLNELIEDIFQRCCISYGPLAREAGEFITRQSGKVCCRAKRRRGVVNVMPPTDREVRTSRAAVANIVGNRNQDRSHTRSNHCAHRLRQSLNCLNLFLNYYFYPGTCNKGVVNIFADC